MTSIKPVGKPPLRGKAAQHKRALMRFFGGLPVIDAKRSLRVFAERRDILTANQRDPTRCVFANACRRMFGSHSVAFFHTVAYVELPDEVGNRRIERFIVPLRTRRSIEAFDKTGNADPGGYHLTTPAAGSTLNHKLKWGQDHPRSTHNAKKSIIRDPEVRSGKGIVRFLRGEKTWERTPS